MHRHLKVFIATAAVAACAATLRSTSAVADDNAAATIQVLGVRSCAASYNGELLPFATWAEGVSVALLVKPAAGQVTGLDHGSRVKEFGDDTGADLFVGSSESGRQTGFGQNVQVAKDASAILVEVETPKQVTKGTKSIHVEGKLVLHTANGTEAKKVAIAFEDGAKWDAPIPITVEKCEETGNDEMPLTVTIKSTKSFETIAGWKFQDESGVEVKSMVFPAWSMGMGGETTYQLTMTLGKKIKKGDVILDVRKDVKTATVPFKLDVSLGL
jgi:hypothetical protein